MSTGSVSTGGSTPINVSGLASGLDTGSIITALLSVERLPITHLTNQQTKISGQQTELQTLQTNLQQLTFAVAEFSRPSLFETSQTAVSSEPLRIGATVTSGAGVGGYQVEVTQLANSAQRSFTFASPAAEDTITIEGREYTLKAGASAKELAAKINSDGKAGVYAAVTEGETIVLSSRTTGAKEGEFITVSDPGGVLTEKAGTVKEGKNAEYSVDGVAGTSTSNIVTSAIAGVTLTFNALTTTAGPVTVAVQPPGLSTSSIESQLNSFVALYNKTVEEIQTQLTTKPLPGAQSAEELATGTLFGDADLSGLLGRMRQAMYEPIEGLEASMSSPFDLGLGTGASTGSASKSAVAGLLKLDPAKLASALQANPEGTKKMLQKWSISLQATINAVAEPGGALETRANGDGEEVRAMKLRITTMNEMLAVRQKSLEATYARLEAVISKNSAQGAWLTSQAEQLSASGI
jgi:flagellar hook-associated protein 2